MTRRYTLSLPAPDCALADLLSLGSTSEGRCYYRSPDGVAVAGLGEALVLSAWGPDRFDRLSEDMRRAARDFTPLDDGDRIPPFVGGFSFAPDWEPQTGSAWDGFAPARLVVPDVALLRGRETTVLIGVAPAGMERSRARAHLVVKLAAIGERLIQLRDGGRSGQGDGVASALVVEARGDYEALVDEALTAIRSEHLVKVAVARAQTLELPRRPAPKGLLEAIERAHPDCFSFWVQPPDSAAFVGASPERLLATRDGSVRADALAGTAPRSADGALDAALGRDLLDDPKERREHDTVVGHLRETLAPLTRRLEGAAVPSLLRLANVQHLHTPFEGELANGEGVLDIVARLHPTPAVAGVPRDRALQWLAQGEDLDRGWYAGGVGLVEPGGDGEFCVAIRSGLIHGRRALLYAGAGIVAGSEPARERREVEHKLDALREVLRHA